MKTRRDRDSRAPALCATALSATALRSPAWHRKARLRRSKTRTRLRKGLPLPARDAWLLLQHHATNPSLRLKLCRHMGGKAPWRPRGGKPKYGDSEYWQWWPGTWSPRQRQKAERYDDLPVSTQQSGHYTEGPGASSMSENMKFMQELQRAVTQARRMDAKVRKLKEDKIQKTQQWEKYQTDTKRKFLKNRQAYQDDMEKLDQAVAEATTAGQESAELARQIVLRGASSAPTGDAMDVDHWTTLLEGEQGAVPDAPDSFLGQMLSMAGRGAVPSAPGPRMLRPEIVQQLMAYMGIGGQPAPPHGGAPGVMPTMAAAPGSGTEPHPAHGGGAPVPTPAAMTMPAPAPPGLAHPGAPPGYTNVVPPAGLSAPPSGEPLFMHPEPFVGSPTPMMDAAGPPPTTMPNASPGQRNKPPIPRVSVKQRPPIVTAPLTGPSLDSKLDATRAAALRPFGLPHLSRPVELAAPTGTAEQAHNDTRPVRITEGDSEEDDLDDPCGAT